MKSKAAETAIVEWSAYHSRMLRFSIVNANKKRLLASSRFEWWTFQRAFLMSYRRWMVRRNNLSQDRGLTSNALSRVFFFLNSPVIAMSSHSARFVAE